MKNRPARLIIHCCFIPFLFALTAVARDVQTGKRVEITTPDGIILSGLYHPPTSRSQKTFILLHGLGSSQEEWQSFKDKLTAAGYGFLSYDARGHGRSNRDTSNREISYQRFGNPGANSEWQKMLADLGSAVAFLNNEKYTPSKKIGLAGASLGANVIINYAAGNKDIPLIVLLSPGLQYAGFESLKPLETLTKRSILIAASPRDIYAYQSSILLHQRAQKNNTTVFMAGKSGHGVQMFDGRFGNQLIKWINRH